jgi:microcystin-dependent protein
MPNPAPYTNFQALDANGEPYVGGKVYTYAAGTGTEKDAYQDSALSIPAPNPIVLDSRGEATFYLDGSYKLVLKDSDDVTIWTVDGVASPATTDGNESTNDYAKFISGGVITGRSYAEVKSDLNLEIGTDVLAQQTIGIANDNLIEVDGTPNSGEYARFTTDGLEGRTVNELASDIGASIPVGGIIMWPEGTPPSGYLECDGSAISRSTYSDLFAVIDVHYGAGNGSTTFNIPDLRGRFVRGYDHGAGNDPDAGTRTDRGDATTGDNPGTLQDDEYEAHTHAEDGGATPPTAVVGGGSYAYCTGTSNTGSSGGNETRPINIGLMFIIKT